MEKPTCRTCQHWHGVEFEEVEGYFPCYRFPQVVDKTKHHHCGEHPQFPAYLESLKPKPSYTCQKCGSFFSVDISKGQNIYWQRCQECWDKSGDQMCPGCQDRTDHCLDCQGLKSTQLDPEPPVKVDIDESTRYTPWDENQKACLKGDPND